MSIKATIAIDDDRWAKHPYGVEFDDPDCNEKYHSGRLDSREECYKIIKKAREDGYNIDLDIDERFY